MPRSLVWNLPRIRTQPPLQVVASRELLHSFHEQALTGQKVKLNSLFDQSLYRALNQAIGRCLRHRLDYGAIILVDERFKQPRNQQHLSRWFVLYHITSWVLHGLIAYVLLVVHEHLQTLIWDLPSGLLDSCLHIQSVVLMVANADSTCSCDYLTLQLLGSKQRLLPLKRQTILFRVKGALTVQPDFSSVLSHLQQFFHRLSSDPPGGSLVQQAQQVPTERPSEAAVQVSVLHSNILKPENPSVKTKPGG